MEKTFKLQRESVHAGIQGETLLYMVMHSVAKKILLCFFVWYITFYCGVRMIANNVSMNKQAIHLSLNK